MNIVKRDGSIQSFHEEKIKDAMRKAFRSTQLPIEEEKLHVMAVEIAAQLTDGSRVEDIQDKVEEALMKHSYFQVAKNYILYRSKRSEQRKVLQTLVEEVQDEGLKEVFLHIQKDFDMEAYDMSALLTKLRTFLKETMNSEQRMEMLIRASVEMISKDAPKWEYIAARLFAYRMHNDIAARMQQLGIQDFYGKLAYLTKEGYYGSYILENYTQKDIAELEAYLQDERDQLFTYSGLELVVKRYLMRAHNHDILETPQEMFMGIAMHLAIPEQERVVWAKKIYDVLSSLKATMATPTMSNARRPYHQLSSCFIDCVDDSLMNIYKSIENFAQVSKYGGGMGLYFGKVRASGSDIRGYEGAAGGIIRWIKLVNDTATAVDQLGVRQGAVAVYLDVWHKDLPEFLNLRTNNGDDRMKAHDIFPALCYPDLFWRMAKEDLNATWYLMCPHEIHKTMGYHLEDYYGEEWEKRYFECVNDPRISKREMLLKDIVRLILKSAVETGTPFVFNRDHVNRMNPNGHEGMIYCSNLCTEIAQNMKPLELLEKEIVEVDGESIVVERSKAGEFVVCNLASLTLGNLDVQNDSELREVIRVLVRALDNVIDLNYYPLSYAKITNRRYRPIGLGVSGYHHMLAKQGLRFESEEHLAFVDTLFEKINYYALEASSDLAKEKGSYACFEGSDYATGSYFDKRSYVDEKWRNLRKQVKENGLRNGYLMAVAPTSSTSIISGTSAGVDPIMNKYFLEEKKGSMITRVAPDLSPATFWLYKQAHLIDQSWIVRAAGVRQRHIDQAQSVNLYITNEFTLRKVLNLYIEAWEQGVKTIYYIRSKSLEVEECESCAA